MHKLLALTLTAATLAFAAPAFATGATCDVAKDKWMSEEAIKAKAVELGFDARGVKTEGGCYEVYAIGKDGAKVELVMNPETAEVLATKTAN